MNTGIFLAVSFFILLFNIQSDGISTGPGYGSSTTASSNVTTVSLFVTTVTEYTDFKTSEQHYTIDTTPGKESDTDLRSKENRSTTEYTTDFDRNGNEITTKHTYDKTENTNTTESTLTTTTESTAEELNNDESTVDEDSNLLSLLNITVEYCSENVCPNLYEPAANCQCDELCYFYRDCCFSMIENLILSKDNEGEEIDFMIFKKVREVENKTLMLRNDLTTCVGNGYNVTGFVMVSNCDVMSSASANVIEKCESSTDIFSVHNIPVDHVVDDDVLGTFKNVYCALCNGVPENETVFWKVDITCEVENVEIISRMAIVEIEKVEDCVMQPKSLFKGALRKCYIGEKYINTCDNPHKSDVISLCETYIYPGTVDEVNKFPIYINPHCALCQKETVDINDFYCVMLYPSEQRHKPGVIETPVNLQVVFDFSREKGLVSEVRCVELVHCKFYETYDCATTRCRQLYCQPGKSPFEGECIDIDGVTSGVTRNHVVDTLKPKDRYDNHSEISESYVLEVLSDEETSLIFYAMSKTNEQILRNIQGIIQASSQNIEFSQIQECFCLKISSMTGGYDIMTELFQTLIFNLDRLQAIERRGYSLVPLFMKIRNFHSLDSLECSTGQLLIDTNPSVLPTNSSNSTTFLSDLLFYLPSFGMSVYEENSLWEIGFDENLGVVPNKVVTCDNRPDLNCSMVAYEIYEVEISNTSIKIINSSLTFRETEYVLFQNKVFICANRVTELRNFVDFFMFSEYHTVLSLLTSAISAVSAAIVVVAHCGIKRLRNIHGLNLSALSLSITIKHVLLISWPLFASDTICIIYAACLHFIILNVFVWMNIIGFDMARSITSDKLISQSSPYKKFLRYYVLSLVIPTLIITTAVSLDFTNSEFRPNYGDSDVCWLSNGKSILLFVIGPVAIFLLLNLVFFSVTIKAIYSKAKESKFARNRSYIVVYMKLSLILGLTWVIGIVGAFAEQEWLWVVHLVLNGLQGFSLLVCSLVNVRILRQMRDSMKSSTENKYSSSMATEKSDI